MVEPLDEYWVTFDALPNYAVSNYGTVLNIKKDKELTPSPDKEGFLRVALYHKGIRHDAYVHRLVAKAFFLNYRPDIEVLFKNGDKNDCTVLNLTLGSKRCRVSDDTW